MAATTAVLRGREREREREDTGSGWTQADNFDKLSDKAWDCAGLYIRSLVSIKRIENNCFPSARRAPNLPGPICTCIRYTMSYTLSSFVTQSHWMFRY